jgi:hypothetical protein
MTKDPKVFKKLGNFWFVSLKKCTTLYKKFPQKLSYLEAKNKQEFVCYIYQKKNYNSEHADQTGKNLITKTQKQELFSLCH